MPERPIELRPVRRLSVLLTTHSKAASQPVSSLIHCAGFPATRTGTQNASLHILIGSISHLARFESHLSRMRTRPSLKSIWTMRLRNSRHPRSRPRAAHSSRSTRGGLQPGPFWEALRRRTPASCYFRCSRPTRRTVFARLQMVHSAGCSKPR